MSEVNVEDLIKALSSLTVLQAADLAKKLEEEWGVSAAMPTAAVAVPGDADKGAADEQSTTCLVMLKDVGSKKINVVKEVRAITALGLFDAKALVDNVANEPQQIKQQMPREEAEEIKKKLEAAGAAVDLVSA